MIVDASALAAIILGEPEWERLLEALSERPLRMPATALTELQLAMAGRSDQDAAVASALIDELHAKGLEIISFELRHTILTPSAREQFGKGNGKGGKLNFGDLMVYAVAKDWGEPLLCTGRDFVTTDLVIHPASRLSA